MAPLLYLLFNIISISATKLITIPLFEERSASMCQRNQQLNSKLVRSVHSINSIPLICEHEHLSYGIIRIGQDQSTVHGNGPVNSDGSRDFKVVFDTGSTVTWVFGTSVTNVRGYKKSFYKSAFEIAKPTLYEFKSCYGGSIRTNGMYYMDKVCVINLCAFSQFIGVVTKYDAGRVSKFDGLFGLGNFKDPLVPLHNTEKIKVGGYSVLEHLLAFNRLNNVFALWLNSTNGVFTLGGPDLLYYHEPITYFPVVSNKFQRWQIEEGHILVNSEEFVIYNASLDSGSGSIFGPRQIITKIWRTLKVDRFGYFKCDRMSTLPIIAIFIQDYPIYLKPDDYTYKVDIPDHELNHPDTKKWYLNIKRSYDNDLCHCGFRDSNKWILGKIFLQKVYTVFDAENQRVGFAEPKTL